LSGKILRLYPLPAQELPARGIYEDLELPPAERRDPSRPYVIINMVSSIDGKVAIEGKSSRIGSETDRRVMRTLRSKADAVLIGAGTLRAEKLSLGLDDSSCVPQPLAVVATRTGDLPLKSNLIVSDTQEVLLLTTRHAPENLDDRVREGARVLRVPAMPTGDVDLGKAFKILEAEHAVKMLLVEGGPSLNYSLVTRSLADELFITLAPKLLGGISQRTLTILHGRPLPPEIPQPNLLSIHLSSGELFLRYALGKG
jgi:2,5-diamino-6-(ribosylamino)-4(3H)-pyrimidinone 5'-phosphate reductase